MARAAVIPQSPPKRATRGRAKGTTTKTTGKQSISAKTTKATEMKKRNARVTVAHEADSASEEDTDDEIGVIDNKSRGRGTASKAKSTSTTSGRGRKVAAAPEPDSESENDNDELAQSGAPKKRAGRPKTKTQTAKEGATGTKTAATSRPRGRPKGTGASAKAASEDDILRQNTRWNSLSQDSDDLRSSHQEPTQIFITTGSALLRGPVKTKKKVTFQEMSDSDDEELTEAPAPTARGRRGTIVAKDQDGMAAKPVRKAATGATRGRKPAAAKKGGAKPLSPKKDRQVAKAISSYASSDGEDDELNGDKDAIKLVVHSPQKRTSGVSGLGSPVRRINFTPNKSSNAFDENGEPNLPPAKAFDFGDSQFMSSPARRAPPSSPFHFTLRETPKRGLSFHDNSTLSRPEATPTQNSPLRTSPKKANLLTPKPGSLFGSHVDGTSQPSLAPGQNSPLKTSPRKGLFGTSFSSSQQQPQHDSTPFKSSLLLSPAKKISTPFKNSLTKGPSSLAKETRAEAEVNEETDDETVSMYDESPSRQQNFEDVTQFDGEEAGREDDDVYDEPSAGQTPECSPIAHEPEHSEEEDEAAQSEYSVDYDEVDEGTGSADDEVSPVKSLDDVEDDELADQEEQDMVEEAEVEVDETAMEEVFDDDQNDEYEGTITEGVHHNESSPDRLQEEDVEDEPEAPDAWEDEPEMEASEAQAASTPRFSFAAGLDDIFTESSPVRDAGAQNDETHDVVDNDDGNAVASDDDGSMDFQATVEEANDEPTLLGGSASPHSINDGPIQPYEIEEVEDTPFMNFLLTHWAPTLPCVDCLPTSPPAIFAERRSPRLSTPEDELNEELSSPFNFADFQDKDSTPQVEEQPKEQSVTKKGPRFTLLAEQFSQWKTSSPAKSETQRPRRRGVFSLGRSSDIPSAAFRATPTDIFANAPTFSAVPQSQQSAPANQTHEDEEDEEPAVNDVDSNAEQLLSSPIAALLDHQGPNALEVFEDGDEDEAEEDRVESPIYPALEPEEDKENEGMFLPPATPAKNPSLPPQVFHTVSKVPLKPEGEVSPLKVSRKRGRSLSITSPVRSSPRLRNFTLPPKEPESPPRKSPRLSYASSRKSVSRETLDVAIEPQPSRARTPSRSASPSKTPRKQVAAYSHHLRGAVVFVDVHTTEGEDASGIFIELLQSMGARCIRNWSWNPRMSVSPEESAASANGKVGISHVVFKDGGVRTLEKVRQAAGLVKCVGVGWVLDCEREGKWVDETPYAVDSSIIPRGGAKRRKSMEPRALSNVNGTLVKTSMAGTPSSRRPQAALGSMSRSTTPDNPSTPKGTRGQKSDDYKFWQTPKTPGFNLDSIGMSPATPFYLNQRSKLVQQTCPPKQTQQGLFGKTPAKEGASRELKAKLEAARRKSLAYKPAIGSPLVE